MKHYVGVDWGGEAHAVCVINEAGKIVLQCTSKHDADGLADMLRKLRKIAPPAELSVAIERPNGLLVDTLVDAGHPVVPIHPNALKACRPRYRAAGGKSDPGDAFILADVLRTDGHRFRQLKPASDRGRALRTMVRTRDDLVAARISLANQLRSHLEAFWSGAATVFADIDSAIALAFLDRYPTPKSAEELDEKHMSAFLANNGYSGRRKPEELLVRLRSAPVGLVGEAEAEARGAMVRALVAVIRVTVEQIRKVTSAIERTVGQLTVGRIVTSFPRAGDGVNAAQIAAELGEDPARFATDDQLAAEAGVAPVTHASGKSRGVARRHACNKRLLVALTCFANNSRHESAWAAAIYRKARARGCDHPHAVRILARAWVRVLWRCWRDDKPYDPAVHGGAKGLQPPPEASAA